MSNLRRIGCFSLSFQLFWLCALCIMLCKCMAYKSTISHYVTVFLSAFLQKEILRKFSKLVKRNFVINKENI